jgi:hypothetical protein
MVLGRVVMQDQRFASLRNQDFERALGMAEEKYFPNTRALRNSLNLTWYRPRDVALF